MVKEINEIRISYGEKVTNNKLKQITFSKVVEQIRSNKWEDKVKQLQQLSDKKQKQEFKKTNFPYFNMGQFESNKRSKFNLQSSQHFLYDYDSLTEKSLADLKENLKSDNRVFCFFTSPSGNGLKVIYKLDSPITDHTKFTDVYKHYAKIFKVDLGANPDKTSDAGRPCYLSCDPDIYVNDNAASLTTDIEETVIVKTEPKTTKLDGVKEGERDNTLISLCGTLINKGIDKDTAISLLKGWNLQNKPPLSEDEVIKTVSSAYERYSKDASCFIERDNSYYKVIRNRNGSQSTEKITSFIIKPKELLTLPDRDILVCNIETSLKSIYTDVHIENTDWISKQKFLKALGHSDCVFLGSERDLQLLCDFINYKIKVKKQGTKTIGLYEGNTWVTKNLNIDQSGIVKDVKIVPYDKGEEAFYNKIAYELLPQAEQKDMIQKFYDNITRINKPEIILPWIAWLFATPLKPLLKNTGEGFPLIFVHGAQGSGKTSSATAFMRLCGYNISDPFSCTMKIFPMLKVLSSTNAVPVFLDEFKKSDMREDQYDSLLRFMRKAYMGEVESKGRADQTTEDYYISAPLCVMGEWNISQPALMERMLIIRFDGSIKKDIKMQEAFDKLKSLKLEAFMPGYIQFCLKQDVNLLMSQAKEKVNLLFNDKAIAPRIKHNLSIMTLGLILFQKYGEVVVDIDEVIKKQLKEITGSERGFVRSAVDQLLEELSTMVSLDDMKCSDYYTTVKQGGKTVLAIRFNEIYSLFREHIKRRSFDGDLLDKESYKRLFKDTDYILHTSTPVRLGGKTHRALCVDISGALKAGVNLDGFDVTGSYGDVTE